MRTRSLLALLLCGLQAAGARGEGVLGVAEGFYWRAKDAVRGQSGQYSHAQRLAMIEYAGSISLNHYLYTPQTVDTMAMWSDSEQAEWTETQSKAQALGIRLVVGLRPGLMSSANFTKVSQLVASRVGQIRAAGITDVILAWDDVEGGNTLEQMAQQRDLVTATVSGGVASVWGVVPAAYYGNNHAEVAPGAAPTWANKLALLDQMPSAVRFLLCADDINPETFAPSQWPALPSGRPRIFWDNEAAVDTSTRLPWSLPGAWAKRDRSLFTGGAYVLNLAFPPERIIHQVKAATLVESDSGGNNAVCGAAWADYLQQKGFVNSTARAQVQKDLIAAIAADQRYDSIAALVAAYPSFDGVWDGPPLSRFHCDSATGQCVAASAGHSTMKKCLAACAPHTA